MGNALGVTVQNKHLSLKRTRVGYLLILHHKQLTYLVFLFTLIDSLHDSIIRDFVALLRRDWC